VLLEQLLRGTHGDDQAAAAAELGLAAGPYRCVVLIATPAGAFPRPVNALAPELTVVRAVRGNAQIALAAGPAPLLEHLPSQVRPGQDIPGGTSELFDNLAQPPAAFRVAEFAACTAELGTVVAVIDRLPEALLVAAPEFSRLLRSRTLASLDGLRTGERAALLETVAALAEHQWSPTAAAAALHCHRNTVLHRLKRLAALSGSDVTQPRTALLWQLAALGEAASSAR
jgi:hypothetical protein